MEAHELKPLRKRRTEAEQDRRASKGYSRLVSRRARPSEIVVWARVPVTFNYRRTQAQEHTHAGEIARRQRAEARSRAR